MRIKYVDHSIANNFGTHIEMHRGLKDYPRLHRQILRHELKHTNKLFSIKDLKNDLLETNINNKELLKFLWNHPSSYTQLLPLYYDKKYGFVYDLNLFLIYIALISIITTSIFFGYFLL